MLEPRIPRSDLNSKIAEELEQCAQEDKLFVIDAFAGVGGNAIAFALSGRWKRVYAIEKDASSLACAKHNAKLYGVEHLIAWIEGDSFLVVPKVLASLAEHAIVFASPPWGGKKRSRIHLNSELNLQVPDIGQMTYLTSVACSPTISRR